MKKLLCVGLVGMFGFSALAINIYDDFVRQYSNPPRTFGPMGNMQEIGNEISIAPNYSLTNFAIEYWTPDASLAGVGIDVRFYNQGGTATNGFPTPTTVFYDSGWFYGLLGNSGPPGNGYNVVDYALSDLYSSALPGFHNLTGLMPTDFTFTITFTNLDAFHQVYMPLATNTFNMLIVGQNSFGDYWTHEGAGIWTIRSTNFADANLVVNFAGTPEPAPAALAAIGGALLLGFNWLRRKR